MAGSKFYEITSRWIGERRAVMRQSSLELLAGYPPRFGKAEPAWAPEELFLASLDLSLMSAYLDQCSRSGLRPLAWEGRGKAEVTLTDQGNKLTSLILSPRITVPRWEDMDLGHETMTLVKDSFALRPLVAVPLTVDPELVAGPAQGREGEVSPRVR